MEVIVILALIALLALREYLAFKERKDVLDRLMAKSLPEYKENVVAEEEKEVPPDTTIADLEDAREEIESEEDGQEN